MSTFEVVSFCQDGWFWTLFRVLGSKVLFLVKLGGFHSMGFLREICVGNVRSLSVLCGESGFTHKLRSQFVWGMCEMCVPCFENGR